MRIRLLISVLMTCAGVQMALAQKQPAIASFTSDRQRVTPDEAESGTAFVNLAWETAGMRRGDTLHLQVYVLGQWNDALPDALPANGALRWAVPHTLDFIPPTFRLVIRDPRDQVVDSVELVIPYSTEIDPKNPPQIVSFTTPRASITAAEFEAARGVIPIAWKVIHRPARANLKFEQVLVDGKAVSVELPRYYSWVRSEGDGVVRPQPVSSTFVLRARLVNVDTGEVYAEQILPVAFISQPAPTGSPITGDSTSGDSGAPRPVLTSVSASNYNPKRGETITVNWQTLNTTDVWIEVRDIDYFPRSYAPSDPVYRFENLPVNGSVDLPIAPDYKGGGWQIHFTAGRDGFHGYDGKRLDLIFPDAPQPIWLRLNRFTVSANPIRLGDTVTVAWDGRVTTRTSIYGVVGDKPLDGYDDKLVLDVTGIAMGEAMSPDTPLNQHFAGLYRSGSLQIVIPSYDPFYNGVLFVLGMDVDGQPITFDNIFVPMDPPENLARTETMTAAYQPFEHGFMLWFGATGDVQVYYGFGSGQAEIYPQSSYQNLPDNPVTDSPPNMLFKPINAFGRMWGNVEAVRSQLGWATTPEQGYTLTMSTRLDNGAVTLTLPNGIRIYQLGNSWTQQ